MDSKIRKTVVGSVLARKLMLFQPKGMRMSSESERSSPLPVRLRLPGGPNDSVVCTRRPPRIQTVVPAMFIEDCARCETLADKRRREGFYKHFYRTLLTERQRSYPATISLRRFSLLRPSILQSMIRLLRTKARTWPPFRYGNRSVLVNTG